MRQETQTVFPIVYGSMAFSMGKKIDATNTHKWICYVRGVNNEDLSYLIKKVEFILHQSFDEPVKTIIKPPFEVKQQGWGQFQIMIRIFFQHPTMPPIEIPHMLKLHHSHTSGAQAAKKPLCSQVYDEIVFTTMDEHIEKMMKGRQSAELLQVAPETQNTNEEGQITNPQVPLKSIVHYSKYLTQMKPEDHRIKLDEAIKFINHQIKSLQQKMRNTDTDLQKVYQQIYNRLP